MQRVKKIHIGTSGWHYSHWKGSFYPERLAAGRMLRFYGGQFHTVEINNSFYHLPEAVTVERWLEDSPPGFLFSVKASRYITHMKKLKEPHDTLPPLLERFKPLGAKQGPILFQLPPKWRFNAKRFETFVAGLPRRYRYTFEFRDPSWFNPRAYELLEQQGIALCLYELAGFCSPQRITSDFIYIRLHGPGDAYQGCYDAAALAGWSEAIGGWAEQGKEIFCYFDNDQAGYAAQNALQLQTLLAAQGV